MKYKVEKLKYGTNTSKLFLSKLVVPWQKTVPQGNVQQFSIDHRAVRECHSNQKDHADAAQTC